MEFDIDTMYCGAIKRGDIFLIQADEKSCMTAVVLQDSILNERLANVLVVPIVIRRAGERIFKNEVLLKKNETSFGKEGVCLLSNLVSVDRRLFRAKKGEIKPQRLAEFYAALDISLGRFRD